MPKGLRKSEVARLLQERILPALGDQGFVLWQQETLVKLTDELLLGFGLERSGFGRGIYLVAGIQPLYAPWEIPVLSLTLGERSNSFAPGTPGGFNIDSEDETNVAVEQITKISRDHLIPFLDKASSSRSLLQHHDSGDLPPIFRSNRRMAWHDQYEKYGGRPDDYLRPRTDWHYCYLLGFVAAYCGEYERIKPLFEQARFELRDCHESHDDARRSEMAGLENLLGDAIAIRRYLATHAYRNRELLKLPFPFDPTVYGLPPEWHPTDSVKE